MIKKISRRIIKRTPRTMLERTRPTKTIPKKKDFKYYASK